MKDILFDYESASKAMGIPIEIVQNIQSEVQKEFPHDAMLMELHVLRALNAYANNRMQGEKH